MYLSTVFYRKKDLYTISDIEIFIFYLNLMTLPARAPFVCPARVLFLIPGFTVDQLLTSVYR